MQGQIDVPLNDNGERQAAEAGLYFTKNNIYFNIAYSSDLRRAKDTALIIAPHVPCVELIGLRERSLGLIEGKYIYEAQSLIQEDPNINSVLDFGESHEALLERVYNNWRYIVDKAIEEQQENVLVVTHGGVIRTLMKYVVSIKELKCDRDHIKLGKAVVNCSLTIVEDNILIEYGLPIVKARSAHNAEF